MKEEDTFMYIITALWIMVVYSSIITQYIRSITGSTPLRRQVIKAKHRDFLVNLS
jgi:hypothetical protein